MSDEDKNEEMAWELHLQKQLDRWHDALEEKELNTPEAVTAIVLAKYGL